MVQFTLKTNKDSTEATQVAVAAFNTLGYKTTSASLNFVALEDGRDGSVGLAVILFVIGTLFSFIFLPIFGVLLCLIYWYTRTKNSITIQTSAYEMSITALGRKAERDVQNFRSSVGLNEAVLRPVEEDEVKHSIKEIDNRRPEYNKLDQPNPPSRITTETSPILSQKVHIEKLTNYMPTKAREREPLVDIATEGVPTFYIPPFIEKERPKPEPGLKLTLPNLPCSICNTETQWSESKKGLYCAKCEPEIHKRQLRDMYGLMIPKELKEEPEVQKPVEVIKPSAPTIYTPPKKEPELKSKQPEDIKIEIPKPLYSVCGIEPSSSSPKDVEEEKGQQTRQPLPSTLPPTPPSSSIISLTCWGIKPPEGIDFTFEIIGSKGCRIENCAHDDHSPTAPIYNITLPEGTKYVKVPLSYREDVQSYLLPDGRVLSKITTPERWDSWGILTIKEYEKRFHITI